MNWQPGDPEEIENPNLELAAQDTGYVGPDIETDEQAIAQEVYNGLAERVPGWQAHDGNPETWLIEEFAGVGAEIRSLAARVPQAIWITQGTEMMGLPFRVATPATGFSTWVADDDQGYRIRPGTQLTLSRTGDELVGFEVVTGTEIPPGETTAELVEIRATVPGELGNGLDGTADLVDPLPFTVTVDRPTRDGVDAQDETEYVDMMTVLFRIIALRPVLPGDFAILALYLVIGIGQGRAVAMDGYNAPDGTWGHQRMITLVVCDNDGNPLWYAAQQQIRDLLENLREVNWVVHVIDPDYEDIDVTASVTAFAEQDADTVRDACVQALTNYLSPGNWRLGTTSPGTSAGEVIPPPGVGETPGRQTVRVNNLVGLLDRTRGVDWVDVDGVTITGVAGDHELASPITLPRPGQIDVTVTVQ